MKEVVRHYTDRAKKDLLSLDKHIANRIVAKIKEYSETPDPLACAKALSGNLSGRFRYRVGDYRVIFVVDAAGAVTVLSIITIRHRKEAYR